MTDPAPRSNSSATGRWLLIGAVFLVLGGGWFAWRQSHQPSATPVESSPAAEQTASTPAATSASAPSAKETPRRPSKADESDDETAERQMGLWLADPKLEPEEQSRKLWHMAIDPKHSQAVRLDALANSLNLAEDQQVHDEFLNDLTKKELWPQELGEALLDDLYNRSDRVKVSAVAALLPNAEGEFQDHLRDVLRFQLDAEDADDATLIRMAAAKAAEPEESTGGE